MLLLLLFALLIYLSEAANYIFPPDFQLGVGTSAYQIEGAWNEDGKGENIWDRMTHEKSNYIKDKSNGDFACDSYHLYKRDIEMLTELGVDFYRFSLSWSRILPTGFANKINQPGIDYYNKVIDGLLAKNITPMVTLYHWDLPQPIQDLGGWTNELIVDYMADYAKVAFDAFGDRVKLWGTINEPMVICMGYILKIMAPALDSPGIAKYICSHNILKAHAKVYHLFDEHYRNKNPGSQIGISLNTAWLEPQSKDLSDKTAALKAMLFDLGVYSHPIFSTKGDYPPELREDVDKRSAEQGYPSSRLPKFTPEEIEYIKGTSDFFGLNYYTSLLVRAHNPTRKYTSHSHHDDAKWDVYSAETWPSSASAWLKVVPWGLGKLLKWIKEEYSNPAVFITENGFSTKGELEDDDGVFYYKEHLKTLLEAIHKDKCNVIGYCAWSLMDNLEWYSGYTEKFGLYEVDFQSKNKTRTIRKSGKFYRSLIKNRAVVNLD